MSAIIENSTQNNEHKIWWSSLSINEQKYYVCLHPFFSEMNYLYFIAHKTSIKQVYENVINNNLTEKYETICEIFRELKKEHSYLSREILNETVRNHHNNKTNK